MNVASRRWTLQHGRFERNQSHNLTVSCTETSDPIPRHISQDGAFTASCRECQASVSKTPSTSTNIILQTVSERLLQAWFVPR